MNTSTIALPTSRRLRPGFSMGALLLALVLLAGLMPTTAHAQRFGGRGFGPSFGRGLGWGLGVGIGSALIYDAFGGPNYIYSPPVVYTSPPVVYYSQPAPQTVVVYSPPAPAAAPALVAAPIASAPATITSGTGKSGRILYDSNGKPVGVVVVDAEGKQEFVPLAQ
ncbi:MAG TPA: hypothetical protein VK737_09850 [Opitutales bacterium]|jgi:hypothetical protein|nr:hypothetical protein [Opitutales bacterium]